MKQIAINNNKDYSKLSTYFKTNWGIVVIFSISGFLFDGLMSFIPNYLGQIINMASLEKPVQTIITNGILFILLVLFIQVNRFLKRYFVRVFSNRMTYVMRKVSFNYIIRSPLNQLNVNSKGDILNRNLTDISDASEAVRKIATEFFDTFVLLAGYLISLFIMDWTLTLISLGFVFLSIILAQVVSKAVYGSIKAYKQYLSKTKDTTLCYLKNETYYRGLGVNDYYSSKYKTEQNKLEKLADKSLLFQSSLQPLYQIVVWIDIIFIIYLGGSKLIQDPNFLIGNFSAFLSTYMLIATKTARVGKIVNSYQNLKISWERCKIYLHTIPEDETKEKQDSTGLIVKGATFGFTKEEELKNINLSANKGEIVGLCGKVHTGKSTLLQAINGLYDYSGSIKLSGIETKEIRKTNMPNMIGFCSSTTQIYNDSLENNISLGREGDTSKAIYLSCLKDDISKKVNKGGEELSRSVANLSGGQLKRLMVARAAFASPKLLILDNPFESIDEKMSIDILTRIKKEMDESAVLITSNQRNILSLCSRVAFIDNGVVTEDTYSNMLQNKDFVKFLGGQE